MGRACFSEPEPAAHWEGPLLGSGALQACRPLWHFQGQKGTPSGSVKARDRPAGPGSQIPALPRLRSRQDLGLRCFVAGAQWGLASFCSSDALGGSGLLSEARAALYSPKCRGAVVHRTRVTVLARDEPEGAAGPSWFPLGVLPSWSSAFPRGWEGGSPPFTSWRSFLCYIIVSILVM